MGLKGNLATVSLADVFQVLSHGHSTGLLRVQAPEGTRFVEIQDGAISIVSRTPNRIPLGELLVSRGLLTEVLLQNALNQQKQTGKILGQILIEQNVVQQTDLEAGLRFQVEEEICDLFLLKSADFDFLANANLDQKMALGGGFMRLKIDPNSLLLEAARRVDEWKRLEEKVPSQAMLFQLTAEGKAESETGQRLSHEGLVLLKLIAEKRSVESMVQKACLGRSNTNLLLVELWENGLVEPFPQEHYALTAREHLEAGRLDEADRISAWALEKESDPAAREALQKIQTDLSKKKKLGTEKESVSGRVRSEVIRRPNPALIIQKKQAPKGLVIGGFLVLTLLAAGAFWFYTRGKQGETATDSLAQFESCMTLIQVHLEKQEYADVQNLLRHQWSNPEFRAKATEKRDKTQKIIETEVDMCVKRIRSALDAKQDKEIEEAEKVFRKYADLDILSAVLRDSMEEIRARLQSWDVSKKLEGFLNRVAKAKALEGYDAQGAAFAGILKEDPPEAVAVDLRNQLSQFEDRSRQALRALRRGQLDEAVADYRAAKAEYEMVRQTMPGSAGAKQADERLQALETMAAGQERARRQYEIYKTQKKDEEARQELRKYLDSKPDLQLAKQAREQFWGMVHPDEDAACEKLEKEIQSLEAAQKEPAALQKKRELLAQFPYSRAASKVQIRIKALSQPPGAEVLVGGKAHEKPTPTEVMVSGNQCVLITLRKKGYADAAALVQPLKDDQLSVNLEREPAERPRLMPAPANGGLAVFGDYVALVNAQTVAVADLSKPHETKVVRIKRGTAAVDPEKGKASSLLAPVFLAKAAGAGDLLVTSTQNALLRIAPATEKVRKLPLESAPLAPACPYMAGEKLNFGVHTENGFERLDESGKSRFLRLPDGKASLAPDQPPPDPGPTGERPPEGKAAPAPGISFDGRQFYLLRADGRLYSIHADTDDVWGIDLPEEGVAGAPACYELSHTLAVLTSKGKLLVLDSGKGDKKYERQLAGTFALGPVLSGAGYLVISKEGKLTKLASDQDQVIWTRDGAGEVLVPPVSAGPLVLAVASKDALQLFRANSGEPLWRAPLPTPPVALAADAKRVVVSTADGYLWVFTTEP